jgi:IclR family transcriptional regulator, pca regulon regulatory protein
MPKKEDTNRPQRDPRYSQSLERGLAVLTCFTARRPELGISDIATELNLNKSTVHRYAITLVALGYMEQLPSSHKYRLGIRVIDLGMLALNSTGLREHARPSLEQLRQKTGYTVSIAILDGTDILYLDRLPSRRLKQKRINAPDLHPGSKLPAHLTSMGKILLAYLPENERHQRIDDIENLIKHNQKTITSKQTLHQELIQIRETELAVNNEESAPDSLSIATPIYDDDRNVVAAISIAANTSTISQNQLVDTLGPHLRSTASLISARLGFRHDDTTQ